MLLARSSGLLTSLCLGCLCLAMPAWAQTKKNITPEIPADLAPQVETLQAGVKLSLIAEHPSLVTPTGLDIDDEGRIWMIACHTHFRPEEYPGPVCDEVLIFDADGSNRRIFYQQTTATMQLLIGADGWIYLAERDRILRVRDSDGDGRGDREETLAELITESDYPHNGLSGMAWGPDGDLIFALGENFAKSWELKSVDGLSLAGRGEGGIFRCTREGRGLRRIAYGFWNPFGIAVRPDGEIFAVDNDPGSRPPCRLLHIVEGGDYGYQRAYGNASVHPFVAWNGELRGTLGMIHPVGEGPCAIISLGGGFMVPSWSNHAIDYFPLQAKGASFVATRVPLVKGGEHFRPVAMAAGHEGTYYFTDWVFSSYQLHQRGRLWKLEIDRQQAGWISSSPTVPTAARTLAQALVQGSQPASLDDCLSWMQSDDPFLAHAALVALRPAVESWTIDRVQALSDRDRPWAMVALHRWRPKEEQWVRHFIGDPNPEVRFECLRWIADEVMKPCRPLVEHLLSDPQLDFRLFEAGLATANTLDDRPEAGVTDIETLLSKIDDPTVPAAHQGYILRLLPPNHPRISLKLLEALYASEDPLLQREALASIAAKPSEQSYQLLAAAARDASRPEELRADGAAGLALSPRAEDQQLLLELALHPDRLLREEALRALRMQPLVPAARPILEQSLAEFPDSASLATAILAPETLAIGRPPSHDVQAWLRYLDQLPGEPRPELGRRIFFHPRAACAGCHRRFGRGNVVGPDLSFIAEQGDRASVLQSILDPNREVAPQFYTTVLELEDGEVFSGFLLRSSSQEVFRDARGQERTIQKHQIVRRKELTTSLMPGGLEAQLTAEELRDLLAYLLSSRGE
jgi:putative membrane-bound dehydrogenase-like protein